MSCPLWQGRTVVLMAGFQIFENIPPPSLHQHHLISFSPSQTYPAQLRQADLRASQRLAEHGWPQPSDAQIKWYTRGLILVWHLLSQRNPQFRKMTSAVIQSVLNVQLYLGLRGTSLSTPVRCDRGRQSDVIHPGAWLTGGTRRGG